MAFLLKNSCFSVTCFSERLCEAVRARSSIYSPKIVYIYARTKGGVMALKDKRRSVRLKDRDTTSASLTFDTNTESQSGRGYRLKRNLYRKTYRRDVL